MFVNTGTIKPKAIMSIVFKYDAANPYYSRDNIESILKNYGINDAVKELMLKRHAEVFNFLKEKDVINLLKTAKKYNGSVLFSYDSPNKKDKKHKVNFYIIPNNVLGRVVCKNLNKPFSNYDIYLKSNEEIPHGLFSGSPVFVSDEAEKVKFSTINNKYCFVPLKDHKGKIFRERSFLFDREIYKMKEGIYLADVDGIDHYLHIDKSFHGSEDSPMLMLFEYPIYTKEEYLLMKEHENSKDKKITKGEKMKFIVMENRNDWDNYCMDACSLELYNEADVDKVKGIVFKDTRECVGYLPVFYFDDDGYICGFEGWGGDEEVLGVIKDNIDLSNDIIEIEKF